jgi:hypothetical protein
VAQGGPGWTPDDVRGDAPIRLYLATATTYSILAKDGKPDHRIMVEIRRMAPTPVDGGSR